MPVIGPGGVGQTFVAVDPLVEVVTISIVPLDDPLTLTQIEVSIHEGVGCQVEAIDKSVHPTVTSGRSGWLNFNFPGGVAMIVGETYTFCISSTITERRVFASFNQYPEGHLLGDPSLDLRFRVLSAPLPGACCIQDGCLENVGADSCAAAQGTYHGDGRSCDEISYGLCEAYACCTDIGCFFLSEIECLAREDWQNWLGVSGPCEDCTPPLGACCFAGLCFSDRTESECLDVSADWAGPLTDCASCPPCDGPDFDGDGAEDNCDTDIDNDGVRNDDDVCDFTPLGLIVQANGTVPADLDGDCNVDLRDYALWQVSLTGP